MSTPPNAEQPVFGKGLDQLKGRRDRRQSRKPPSNHPRPNTTTTPPPDQEKDQAEHEQAQQPSTLTKTTPDGDRDEKAKAPVPEQARPQVPEKPAENVAGGRKATRRAAETGGGKVPSPGRADAALKTATNLAAAWAANEQRQRKRLVELIDALTKSASLGVSREELAAALFSTQRRVGVEFPDALWEGLAPKRE